MSEPLGTGWRCVPRRPTGCSCGIYTLEVLVFKIIWLFEKERRHFGSLGFFIGQETRRTPEQGASRLHTVRGIGAPQGCCPFSLGSCPPPPCAWLIWRRPERQWETGVRLQLTFDY